MCFEEIDRKCLKYVETWCVGNRPRGVSLAGDLVGNASIGSPLLFVHFLKCINYFVSIAEKGLQ